MNLIYMDINCFQRSFDDFTQLLIQMESLACQEVFRQAENEQINLAWSFMHQDEADLCPWPDRKLEVYRLSFLCKTRVPPEEAIMQKALQFQQQEASLSTKDAIHLAAACHVKATYFLTCDKRFLRQAQRLGVEPMVLNPVEYVQRGN